MIFTLSKKKAVKLSSTAFKEVLYEKPYRNHKL